MGRAELFRIDVVLTWVDGSDPAWLEERARYAPEQDVTVDASEQRYRDWGLLRYLLRGVDEFMPWVRTVFLLTWGHVPEWLDTGAQGLRVVRHDEFIPARYLPTFSSHPIELNMHRVEGLSERFVYFNDDMFPLRPIAPDLYFRDGLPVLPPLLHAVLPRGDTGPLAHIWVNNISAINRHFDFHRSLRDNWAKWFVPTRIGARAALENAYCSGYQEFPGIKHKHVPSPMRVSTIERIWELEPNLLDRASSHRFRSAEDVSPYLFWQWELAAGTFVPCRAGEQGARLTVTDAASAERASRAIRGRRWPLLCVNDSSILGEGTYEEAQERIRAAFESILPRRSRFEL